ncbi:MULTISPECIES: Na(+)-translocating NADH-quinone reductase subunit C [Moraxella]|uniref:Na(+)-translocating NADH-quinone reductase subunit C n=1 Tax=Moraxella lacunata TaxID=477 RepID=A0A1B8Q708_MORLA|nr:MULTISPECIES: Na(+)-translocating NADH-quinone reductase subunit C [Moraxella]MBE9577994.1 Na(+)-translocating NADH-quinone reductase subunit C [Moraxella sp. K1664]MBE9587697.1 Na(+)-translocating NADH-quinone reductase subunit C [Moraxella sp. K1630]MBE9595698.1 Na(+)-translocating NADH-quinone reductase subunit C [Moraxella sp. K2450]MDH9218066.1 Na(+)-translocating NADH-quinone reductase subunit C [Moraxella lacunata]MDI4482075.1 Na(+)-translocating NADH-quinone reductase subunit C [Mor
MSAKNSNVTTLVTALVLCLVCSVMVSAVAVGLKPKQIANSTLDFNKNVLIATGKFNPATDNNSVVAERFSDFEVRMVNLDTGTFATDEELTEAGITDIASYDVAKAARTPALSTPLADDIAAIGGKPKFGKVYLSKDASGQIDMIVLPFHGAGLWGQIYGLLTLDSDFNTIKGVNFYEHKETPGLGSRITEEPWRAQWVDKKVHNDNGDVIMGVAKAGTARPEQVDGISGATLTGRGVHNMVQFWLGKDGYQPFLENLKAGKADGTGA